MLTDNYIKMCEQAEEIQTWYKTNKKNVSEGDRYICRCDTCKENMYVNYVKDSDMDYINKRDMTDVDPNYAAMVSLSGVGEFGAFWDDKGFIYLPTQEQLQEILQKDREWVYYGSYPLTQFCGWITTSGGPDKFYHHQYKSLFKSINELWLTFVMHEKYNKIWTCEKWVKADD